MEDPFAIPQRDSPGDGRALLIRTWHHGEAAVVRQLLATYDIPCQLVSHVPHTVLPIGVEVRILVSGRHLAEARALLAEHRRQGFELVRGGKAKKGRGEG